MLIRCPFCGERVSSEFRYLGSSAARRPDPADPDAESRFVEAVYFRDNPFGLNEELWYHADGCRQWVQVTRDTRTHVVSDVRFSRDAR
jgi:sarcosine oxidase subunit delta